MTKEQQVTLLAYSRIIKEWQECPTLPAIIVWYLSQYANYDQQKDFYQEVQNSPGGLERHWVCAHFVLDDSLVRVDEERTQADDSIVLNDCDRIRAYGAEQ